MVREGRDAGIRRLNGRALPGSYLVKRPLFPVMARSFRAMTLMDHDVEGM